MLVIIIRLTDTQVSQTSTNKLSTDTQFSLTNAKNRLTPSSVWLKSENLCHTVKCTWYTKSREQNSTARDAPTGSTAPIHILTPDSDWHCRTSESISLIAQLATRLQYASRDLMQLRMKQSHSYNIVCMPTLYTPTWLDVSLRTDQWYGNSDGDALHL